MGLALLPDMSNIPSGDVLVALSDSVLVPLSVMVLLDTN